MEDEDETRQSTPRMEITREHRDTCQVDGSWAVNDDWMGAGFVLLEADEVLLQGQRCGRRAKSPLHAEVEGIIWAMKEVRNRGLDDIDFGSDCQQLVKLTGGDEECPALAAELDEVRLLLSNFRMFLFPLYRALKTSVRTPWLREDVHAHKVSRL